MKLYRRIVSTEIQEVVFEDQAEVPTWIFWNERCSKCGHVFYLDYVSLHKNNPGPAKTITVAISQGQRYLFHNECYKEGEGEPSNVY